MIKLNEVNLNNFLNKKQVSELKDKINKTNFWEGDYVYYTIDNYMIETHVPTKHTNPNGDVFIKNVKKIEIKEGN